MAPALMYAIPKAAGDCINEEIFLPVFLTFLKLLGNYHVFV